MRGWWPKLRRRPYTVRGVGSVPCVRCGRPALHQWQVCADKGNWRALCGPCDIALNRMVLRWMRCPRWKMLVRAYEKLVG